MNNNVITFQYINSGPTNYEWLYLTHYNSLIGCKECKYNILVDELIYHVICNAPIDINRQTTYWNLKDDHWICMAKIKKE